MVSHIRTTYIRLAPQWVHAYTRFYRNYGHRIISPRGSHHIAMRAFMKNPQLNLLELYSSLRYHWDFWHEKFDQQMAYEGIKTGTQYLTELWSNTRGYSSHQGLDLVYGQVSRARESLLHPVQRALPPCTGSFTKQYGLPCSHMVVQNLSCVVQNGQRCVIETGAFDLAWWDNTWLIHHDMVRFPSLPFISHVLR